MSWPGYVSCVLAAFALWAVSFPPELTHFWFTTWHPFPCPFCNPAPLKCCEPGPHGHSRRIRLRAGSLHSQTRVPGPLPAARGFAERGPSAEPQCQCDILTFSAQPRLCHPWRKGKESGQNADASLQSGVSFSFMPGKRGVSITPVWARSPAGSLGA